MNMPRSSNAQKPSISQSIDGVQRLASRTSKSTASLLCLVVFSALLSAGCVSPQSAQGNSALAQAPSLTRPDGSVRIDTSSEEVAKLWASAESARAEGKATIALELLYEAIELDPSNSLLWSRAAEIQLDNLEPALAESYATRSNSYAADNRPLLQRNWMIIEHSRSMRGDLLGVRSAHKQVQFFQYQ